MLVYVESPYRHEDPQIQALYLKYAKACVKDCLCRNENPILSHLYYTQFLDDKIEGDRALGIELGFQLAKQCAMTAVYSDLGISEGMQGGITNAARNNRVFVFRGLPELFIEDLISESPKFESLLIT